jgi:hypothetical protein
VLIEVLEVWPAGGSGTSTEASPDATILGISAHAPGQCSYYVNIVNPTLKHKEFSLFKESTVLVAQQDPSSVQRDEVRIVCSAPIHWTAANQLYHSRLISGCLILL